MCPASLERLSTEAILDKLHKIDGSPWTDWYGRLLNARDLAKLLRPHGVRATDVKVDGRALKGYRRDHLHAWTRYLPPEKARQTRPPAQERLPRPPRLPLSGTRRRSRVALPIRDPRPQATL
jgi:hypothetical protein